MSFPRSQQYIRVKKMQLPDPDVYCPIHGYEKPEIWEPPIPIPEPENEQILLLCDDYGHGTVGVYATVTGSNTLFELLDANMNVLSSVTNVISAQITFPTKSTGAYYFIRISPQGSGFINSFRRNPITNLQTENYRILAGYFKTPNIVQLGDAFLLIASFKACKFFSACDALINMPNAFRSTSIDVLQLPSSMSSITDISYLIADTKNGALRRLNLSTYTLNNLQQISYACSNSAVQYASLPNSLPALKFGTRCFSGSDLNKVDLPTYAPLLEDIAYMFDGTKIPGKLTIPHYPSLKTIESTISSMPNLIECEFADGACDSITNANSSGRSCVMLEKFKFPTSMNGLNALFTLAFNNTPVIRKITLPLSLSANSGASLSLSGDELEEITTCENWGSNQYSFSYSGRGLNSFNQPTLKCRSLLIGSSSTIRSKADYIEIDWANSLFESTLIPQIAIRAVLSTAEINRIFTALPIVSGKQIDVRYNVGYASCDKSIATAKGWTVL